MADPTNTPEWLRTLDGRVRWNVLKPFSFVCRAPGLGQVKQRQFPAGEHLLDEAEPEDAAVLAHPWICQDFADGCIESPDQAHARLATEEAEHAARAERLAALSRETEMYTRRSIAATLAQGNAQHHSGADLQDELNRPLNQLPPDVATALDTPLNELR